MLKQSNILTKTTNERLGLTWGVRWESGMGWDSWFCWYIVFGPLNVPE